VDRATAHHEHGILTLTLPKVEEARPKQIKVGSGAKVTDGQGAEKDAKT
jgi:hypothetical protein